MFKAQVLGFDFYMTAGLKDISAVDPDKDLICFVGVPCKLSTIRRETGVKDVNGNAIYEKDRVRVHWLEFVNWSKHEFERDGIVEYMADGMSAAWFVRFDKSVIVRGSYECEFKMLLQTEEADGHDITFTLIE